MMEGNGHLHSACLGTAHGECEPPQKTGRDNPRRRLAAGLGWLSRSLAEEERWAPGASEHHVGQGEQWQREAVLSATSWNVGIKIHVC